MIVTSKVQPDGCIVLPESVVQAAGIEAGDILHIRTIAPRHVEIRALHPLTLEEALERYKIEGPIDWQADREAWEAEAAKDVIGRYQ